MWIWTIIGHYHNTGDMFGSSRRDQTCALQTYMKTGPATGAVNEDSRNVTIIALLQFYVYSLCLNIRFVLA